MGATFTTLFGSHNYKKFQPYKSLVDNFNHMCSIAFFKKNSDETKQLLEILRACTLNISANETEIQLLKHQQKNKYSLNNKGTDMSAEKLIEDIRTLQVAKVAVERWLEQRENSSERISHVKKFLSGLNALQENLLVSQKQKSSISPFKNVVLTMGKINYLDVKLYSAKVKPILEKDADLKTRLSNKIKAFISSLVKPRPQPLPTHWQFKTFAGWDAAADKAPKLAVEKREMADGIKSKIAEIEAPKLM